ncbi:hypothetical protein JL107_10905 [Nakamurella flavida]|uniref:Heavy metal transporter n=1 Tax=Nakamurella flavida TaxID=363630 RepID=A0A939C3D6_9ACTN|nr:hypothetical protein [Nakamurella flavida]MBM9476956.1 hypothetical protein [Nakamurella flavida]MDP9779901.1 hypothetical protein [Nakamurella flavida]
MRAAVIVPLTVVVLAAAAAGVWAVTALGSAGGPECRVPGDPTAAAGSVPDVELTAAQLQNASTIAAVGLSRGLPERAVVIALATAYQESSLRNRPDGDRDSVGLFQQRPSQGWGTAAEIIDPVYSAGRFYDALVEVEDWDTGALTVVAQAVQYSGFPEAYAQWEPQATTLARQFTGAAPLGPSCRDDAAAPTAAVPDRPVVPGAEAAGTAAADLLADAAAERGPLTVLEVSADGRTVTVSADVPVGVDPGGVTAGASDTATATARSLAAWAVAHAVGAPVVEVVAAGQGWTDAEWSDRPGPDVPAVRLTVG